MENSPEIIKELNKKIQLIITTYERMKDEKQILINQNNQLSFEIENQKKIIKDLEIKYDNLKIAKSIASENPDDKKDVKGKINHLVREIDKCIALLNQ